MTRPDPVSLRDVESYRVAVAELPLSARIADEPRGRDRRRGRRRRVVGCRVRARCRRRAAAVIVVAPGASRPAARDPPLERGAGGSPVDRRAAAPARRRRGAIAAAARDATALVAACSSSSTAARPAACTLRPCCATRSAGLRVLARATRSTCIAASRRARAARGGREPAPSRSSVVAQPRRAGSGRIRVTALGEVLTEVDGDEAERTRGDATSTVTGADRARPLRAPAAARAAPCGRGADAGGRAPRDLADLAADADARRRW